MMMEKEEEDSAPMVTSPCDKEEEDTIVASDDEVEVELEEEQQQDEDEDLDATFLVGDDSALKLAQRELSSASYEQDMSWIADPLQYRKNLDQAAFGYAAAASVKKKKADTTTTTTKATNNNNNNNNMNPPPHQQQNHPYSLISDPTPSKATVAVKIARFEQKQISNSSSSSSSNNSGIAVYLRTRPSSDTSNTIEYISTDGKTRIRTHAPPSSNAAKFVRKNGSNNSVIKEYEFTGVFGEDVAQRDVYQATVQPQLEGILNNETTNGGDGQSSSSALVFCYGITNAGKTYTVTGPESSLHNNNNSNNTSEWGLVPRALQELYERCNNNDSANNDQQQQRQLTLSYFEVYNEQIYDLLSATNNNKSKNLYADTGIDVKNVSRHGVTSVAQGLALIAAAQKARVSGTNRINARSSRSHAVCRMSVSNNNNSTAAAADLWIVDLAGSERARRTGGIRWQEAVQINKSLMTLNRCLMALRKTQNHHHGSSVLPPYRESKLTQLFGSHWTSHSASRTTMIVNVNPAASDFDETQHVLAYASAARTVVVTDSNNDVAAQQQNKKSAAAEYGYDGRRVRGGANNNNNNKTTNSCIKKIKAVVRKLSPKRNTTKNKTQSKQIASTAKRKLALEDPGSVKRTRFDHTEEVTSLRKELKSAKKEHSNLQEDYTNLASNIDSIEPRVRSEMQEQMESLTKQYETRAEAAKEQVTELLDTVAECEDEMERMREQHVADLAVHQNKYERIVQDKKFELETKDERIRQLENQVSELKEQMKGTSSDESKQELEAQIKHLRQELEEQSRGKEEALQGKQAQIEKLEHQVEELQQALVESSKQVESEKIAAARQIEQLKKELEGARAGKFPSVERKRSASDGENQVRPKARSARYQATHEEVVDLSARRVFGSVVNKAARSFSDSSSDGSNSNDSFGPSKWLKPRRKVKQDPATGTYLRPRGRAPSGVEAWDENKGAWRLSNAF